MKVRPLGERVLVKMEKVEEKTAGGIFIPQTSQEKTQGRRKRKWLTKKL